MDEKKVKVVELPDQSLKARFKAELASKVLKLKIKAGLTARGRTNA